MRPRPLSCALQATALEGLGDYRHHEVADVVTHGLEFEDVITELW